MVTNIWRPKRATTFRRGGWLAVVTLLGLGLGLGLAAPVLASNAMISGTDHGATVTVTGWRQVWAGDLSGTIDGAHVKFYCIDTGHTISIPSVDPYTNDGPTSAQITYILNNYFPFVTSASGQLSSPDQEAAAVQLAIWHFSDGITLSNITDATIGNRALAIETAATSATSTSAHIVTAIKIVPPSQTNPGGTPGTFTVEAFDSSSTRMSGVEIALTTTSGTLSTSSVTTTDNVETPVTLTQDSSLAATVTAKTTRHIPGGTIYVDATDVTGGVPHQKLVIATPTSDTLTTTGGFKWAASPTITTETGGTVVLGSGVKLTDSATLAGGVSPTGTITFTLTNPASDVKDTEIVPVDGNGVYSPTGFLPDKAGTWHWVASYSGDGNNAAAASGADEEPVVVSPASPTIATVLSKSKGTVGDTIHDTATLTGTTATAGGKVTYTVYTNTACTSGAIDAGTKTVTNGSVPNSDGIVFNSVGTWYWQAVYSGDASNAAATSACTEETLVVDASPSPSTSATPTPFQRIEGETATPTHAVTPPPTTTGGGPSGDSPAPFFALMICFAFGGLGLLAVQRQRRTLSR